MRPECFDEAVRIAKRSSDDADVLALDTVGTPTVRMQVGDIFIFIHDLCTTLMTGRGLDLQREGYDWVCADVCLLIQQRVKERRYPEYLQKRMEGFRQVEEMKYTEETCYDGVLKCIGASKFEVSDDVNFLRSAVECLKQFREHHLEAQGIYGLCDKLEETFAAYLDGYEDA